MSTEPIPSDKLTARLAAQATGLAALAGALVAALALLAFALSYASLRHMAESNGVGSVLSWVWPLLLDFAMIVFSLAILRANLRGEPTWYPWVLTIIYASLATVANVLDVVSLGLPPVAIAAGVKAIAPITLVLAFELLMQMVRAEAALLNGQSRDHLREQAVITTMNGERSRDHRDQSSAHDAQSREQAVIIGMSDERSRDHRDQSDDHREQSREQAVITMALDEQSDDHDAHGERVFGPTDEIEARRVQVLGLLRDGMTVSEIADQVGVSPATIRRDRSALNGMIKKVMR